MALIRSALKIPGLNPLGPPLEVTEERMSLSGATNSAGWRLRVERGLEPPADFQSTVDDQENLLPGVEPVDPVP
jgi:hypothetical protein